MVLYSTMFVFQIVLPILFVEENRGHALAMAAALKLRLLQIICVSHVSKDH